MRTAKKWEALEVLYFSGGEATWDTECRAWLVRDEVLDEDALIYTPTIQALRRRGVLGQQVEVLCTGPDLKVRFEITEDGRDTVEATFVTGMWPVWEYKTT